MGYPKYSLHDTTLSQPDSPYKQLLFIFRARNRTLLPLLRTMCICRWRYVCKHRKQLHFFHCFNRRWRRCGGRCLLHRFCFSWWSGFKRRLQSWRKSKGVRRGRGWLRIQRRAGLLGDCGSWRLRFPVWRLGGGESHWSRRIWGRRSGQLEQPVSLRLYWRRRRGLQWWDWS